MNFRPPQTRYRDPALKPIPSVVYPMPLTKQDPTVVVALVTL